MTSQAVPREPGAASHDIACEQAASQAGVISRDQLLLIKWTPAMWRTHLRAQRWQLLFPGTYLTVTGEPPPQAWWWSACLYAGESSFLYGDSALQAWKVLPVDSEIHVGVPLKRRVRAQPKLTIHRSAAVPPDRPCPAGTPSSQLIPAALLDARAERNRTAVASLVSGALQAGRTSAKAIRAELEDRQRYGFRAEVEAVIAEHETGITTSIEGALVKNVLRPHGLPEGDAQAREFVKGALQIRDRIIEEVLVIETDGRRGHADPHSRFRDRRRDNHVTGTNRRTLRFGIEDVNEFACHTARHVANELFALGWNGFPEKCGEQCELFADGA